MSVETRAGETTTPRETVRQRLVEAGIDAPPFVAVVDGEKACYDHDTRHEVPPAGNYAVYAVGQLVILDDDTYETGGTLPGDLPPTFTVGSPHGGAHRYYLTDTAVGNIERDWGSLRASGWFAVGPGSTVDHDNYCEGDCSWTGTDRYTIDEDRPIERLDPETVRALDAASGSSGEDDRSRQSTPGVVSPRATDDSRPSTDRDGSSPGTDAEGASNGATSTSATLNDDERRRVRFMFDHWRGEELRMLWEGRYADAGYRGDRSAAEQSLANALAFYLDNDPDAVTRAMNTACEDYPGTDEGAVRKWADRRGVYRQSTVNEACTQRKTYTPPEDPLPFEDRPTVSDPTLERVLQAVRNLDRPTTTAIVNHPAVDRGQRQVRRTVSELDDQGLVTRETHPDDGRKNVHYLTD